MSKYPRTRQGMARRRNNTAQFNPHNGEPHSAKWLAQQRAIGLRRWRDPKPKIFD